MNELKTWLRAARRLLLKLIQPFYFYDLKDYLRYREAVELADEAHAKDSDRYYVMPSMDGKLLVMDRKNFRELKRKGYIRKDATIQNAITECFYYTPRIGGQEPITKSIQKAKWKEYKKWCKAMRMLDYFTKGK